MAARKKNKTEREAAFEKFAVRPPQLAVLTDHPLSLEDARFDTFGLRYKLGPVYDIIRRRQTRTPMAILVSGDWGTGKTSAMRWLEGLLYCWNRDGPADRVKVRPVWFCPWKYDNKDDVRRGLIASVILNAIDVTKASRKTVTKAFKLLGQFVGKSGLDLLAGQKISVAGFEVSTKAVRKVIENYKKAAHPERPYLHPFETALERWVADTVGKNERMVIFIDDLDRCLPEVALQVLEALKLYLNIPKLVFVLGVDKVVVEKLVVEHYRKLGLVRAKEESESEEDKAQRGADEEKAKQYLAKMFQVEVNLVPDEQEIREFLEDLLGREEASYWSKCRPDSEKDPFRPLSSSWLAGFPGR